MKSGYDLYLGYEELTERLKGFAGDYPGLCKVSSIGKSYEGRDIWVAEITNSETGPADDKPAFWVDGNTHAGEVTGSMAALYLIQTLLEGYGYDERIIRLLDRQAFYILPRLSPDGSERYLTTPYTLRATVRPWPDPEEEPGLHPEDLDGDGHIVQMRSKDPNGEWRISDKDPRLMIPRSPDDAEPDGTYYRLYREGTFKDYDGFRRRIARPLYGLDMNRQYPYEWREEATEKGAGPYPLSEPESRAQVDFLLAHKNIFSVHTYHTFCGAILRPYSNKPDSEMDQQDLAVYKELGDRGTEITGYQNISVYHDFTYEPGKHITGAFDDWAYSYYGVYAFTIEFWSAARSAGIEVDDFIEFFRSPSEEAQLALLEWNDKELGGEGFSPWESFSHSQLGDVEIGGWKTKFTMQNPPPHLLEAECEKLASFALAHASAAPLLQASLEIEEISPGLRQVELTVENTGYLPTNVSRIAVEKELITPVEVELTLPEGVDPVSGELLTKIGHLSGRSTLAGGGWKSPVFFQGLPSDYARRLKWVLWGEGPLHFEVRGGKAGTVRLESG